MQPFEPVMAQTTDAQIDDPEIGQARGNQQTTEACWIAQMARMQVKPATLLVREEGFNVRPFAIHVLCVVKISHIRHEIDRLGIRVLPHRQDAYGKF